jgi:uncharacterized membrane protein YfcA
LLNALIVFAAGIIAGAMNAAAGGGSFVSLPALVYVGVPPAAANMTSTVALFPGAFASAFAYRNDVGDFEGVSIRRLLPVSLLGGLLGAFLLLYTPSRGFDLIVPWLLLTGAIAFAFGRQIGDFLRRFITFGPRTLLVLQFLLALYGGYFGGAVGMMMMAVWSVYGVHDLRAIGAARTFLVGSLNAVAVVVFAVGGSVFWPEAMLMLAGGLIGGYVGARVARRIDQKKLRIGVSIFNAFITAAFFWRAYG